MKVIQDRLLRIYEKANHATNGTLGMLREAGESFTAARGAEAAASLAYYAFFSLFPLLLVLITVGSYLLSGREMTQQIIAWTINVLPVSPELIARNIETVLQQRNAVGLVGLIGLLWSGTSVFSILSLNINRSFPRALPRTFLQNRLAGLAIVGVLTLFILVSFILRAIVSLVPVMTLPILGEIRLRSSTMWTVVTGFIPFIILFFVFLSLYRLLPRIHVRWTHVFWSALTAASAWEIITSGFTWYLGSGLAQYELIYGSLGTVAALMFYIYLISWITLFGAHLTAAIKQDYERRGASQETIFVGYTEPVENQEQP